MTLSARTRSNSRGISRRMSLDFSTHCSSLYVNKLKVRLFFLRRRVSFPFLSNHVSKTRGSPKITREGDSRHLEHCDIYDIPIARDGSVPFFRRITYIWNANPTLSPRSTFHWKLVFSDVVTWHGRYLDASHSLAVGTRTIKMKFTEGEITSIGILVNSKYLPPAFPWVTELAPCKLCFWETHLKLVRAK